MTSSTQKKNGLLKLKSSKILLFFGEFKIGQTFLRNHRSPFLSILDSSLRGAGQVVFANNPLSGLLVLVGLFLAGWEVGLASSVGALVATLTATILRQPEAMLESGLVGFNGVLVGSVISSLWPLLYCGQLYTKAWVLIVLGSLVSVIIQNALGGFLAGVKKTFSTKSGNKIELGVPGLTLPFNLTAWVIVSILLQSHQSCPETPSNTEDDISWTQVMLGSVLGMGQVFGVTSLPCSCLMFLGVSLFSPLLALSQYLGSLTGCLTSLSFLPPDLIYQGVWGYCPLLTVGALTLFTLPSPTSLPIYLLSSICTSAFQVFLLQIFKVFNLPVFTLPFVVTTWVFLLLSTENKMLIRVENVTTPEQHLMEGKEESGSTLDLDSGV